MKPLRLFPILLIGLLFTSCLQWRYSDRDLVKLATQAHIPLRVHHIQRGAALRYVEVKHDAPPKINVLLIHGAPSSLRIWMSYLTDTNLTCQVNLYAVDRPGYGYSDFGHADTSILHQAHALEVILDRHPGPWVVFGSSYGGPIAAVLAATRPDKIKAMLLTSPSLAPGEEKIYKVSYLVRRKSIGWIAPTIFRVANEEKLSHRNALLEAVPFYSDVRVPVTYMHGGLDSLIYPSNADFARRTFTGTDITFIRLANRPHFFTYSEQPLITSELLKLATSVGVKQTASTPYYEKATSDGGGF